MGDGFKRGRPPVVGRRVERAHRAHGGERATHGEIAVALYEELGSCHRVATAVQERLGVRVSARTVSSWINRELARRAVEP